MTFYCFLFFFYISFNKIKTKQEWFFISLYNKKCNTHYSCISEKSSIFVPEKIICFIHNHLKNL